MRLSVRAELDYALERPTDMLLALEIAPMADQRLIEDRLVIDGATGPLTPVPGEEGIGRRTWLEASGAFRAVYTADVVVQRDPPALERLAAVPLRALPAAAVPYLWPSRYCPADQFEPFVRRTFGASTGGAQIAAMADWIADRLDYVPGASNGNTTAADTFLSRQGVCRDYAHLMASFARAAGVPARLVSCYGLGVEPPDFHAVVEVWLEDGWHLVDATRLSRPEAIARICVGRDATDISFMTAFGWATFNAQSVTVTAG